jgi:hypothetical protein
MIHMLDSISFNICLVGKTLIKRAGMWFKDGERKIQSLYGS